MGLPKFLLLDMAGGKYHPDVVLPNFGYGDVATKGIFAIDGSGCLFRVTSAVQYPEWSCLRERKKVRIVRII